MQIYVIWSCFSWDGFSNRVKDTKYDGEQLSSSQYLIWPLTKGQYMNLFCSENWFWYLLPFQTLKWTSTEYNAWESCFLIRTQQYHISFEIESRNFPENRSKSVKILFKVAKTSHIQQHVINIYSLPQNSVFEDGGCLQRSTLRRKNSICINIPVPGINIEGDPYFSNKLSVFLWPLLCCGFAKPWPLFDPPPQRWARYLCSI